ncbi:prevent-host-death protein [Leifsonia sp. McL0607]|uniref:prevent-host-death protein n=1 Tax=Leifsonia sp. McL0607 TaxID=3415672 RepID=UPI003CEE3B8B
MLATDHPTSVFHSSDLSRHSTRVFAAAEAHPVEVTRRDGEDLVLMSKREASAREGLLQLAATLIGVATDTRGSLAERMSAALPWMLALNPEDRAACADELLDAARASFSTGEAHLAVAALRSWRETATALAAGLGELSVEWIDTGLPVARP